MAAMVGNNVLILSNRRLSQDITKPTALSRRQKSPHTPIYIPAFPWLWLDTMHTTKKEMPEHRPINVAPIAMGGCFLSVNFKDDCFCFFLAIFYLSCLPVFIIALPLPSGRYAIHSPTYGKKNITQNPSQCIENHIIHIKGTQLRHQLQSFHKQGCQKCHQGNSEDSPVPVGDNGQHKA